jgi:hypothetical protein
MTGGGIFGVMGEEDNSLAESKNPQGRWPWGCKFVRRLD